MPRKLIIEPKRIQFSYGNFSDRIQQADAHDANYRGISRGALIGKARLLKTMLKQKG